MKNIFILLFILISHTFSQEIQVDLNKAITLALKNNRLNTISKLNLQLADFQYKQALSANYPTLDLILYANRDNKDIIYQQRGNFVLSSEFTKTLALASTLSISNLTERSAQQAYINSLPTSAFENQTINANMNTIARGRDTVRGQLQLNYPIYTGGKISALIEQARLNKLIKKENIVRDENSVVFDVKKYFYGYILTDELYTLLSEIYENIQFSRDLTKDFLENGTDLKIKQTDYLNIKLLTSLLKSSLNKLYLNKELIKNAISNVIGLKYNDKLELIYDKKDILKQNKNLEELIKKANSLNPEIRGINLALQVKEAQIKEANANAYPMMNLFANASHTYNSYEYGYLSDDDENRWNLGLVVKYSLFDGSRTKNSVLEKKVDKKILNEQKMLLEEAIALQLKNEFLKSSIGYEQINLLKESVQIANENSKMNLKAYKYQMAETRDLVQSQLMEVYVKVDLFKNTYDYLLSLATIDKLIGEQLDKKTY